MKSSIFGGTPVERTVLIRLKPQSLFYSAGLAVFFGGAAVMFGFGDPTFDWTTEIFGPVGRAIFAVGMGFMALVSLTAVVGGLVTRLECVVAYGEDTLYMPESSSSRSFWVPWLRERGMVPIDLRNATLEAHMRMGTEQIVIVISSGNTRVKSYFPASSWDEDDMWRRWADFQASLHGVDMDSLPPNALRPDKSAYEDEVTSTFVRDSSTFYRDYFVSGLTTLFLFCLWVVHFGFSPGTFLAVVAVQVLLYLLEERVRKNQKFWTGLGFVGLLAAIALCLLFFALDNPL